MNQGATSSIQQHDGEIAFSGMTTRNIAGLIESRTHLYVADETELLGKYDGLLHWPANLSDLAEMLTKDLGLTLEKAQRDGPYYVVTKIGNKEKR